MEHVDELVDLLAQLAKLLSNAREPKWHKYVVDCRSRLVRGDYSGADKFLRAFGGMGSLTDVQAGSEAEHARLGEVRSRAYELACLSRRSYGAGR